MDFNWSEYETKIKNRYTKVVYSDDEEFHRSPLDTLYFIKKIGIYSYLVRYHTSTQLCTRYVVPHYNRRCADTILKEGGDPSSPEDVQTNENLDSYQVV
jgi:hypothetical protein